MKFVLTFISLIVLNTNITWLDNFEVAKTEATQNNKAILLNFAGSDWCAPCIKLKQEVFESTLFAKFSKDKLVMLRADFPRLKKNQLPAKQLTHNEALAEKYNPEGKFPFTVLLDAKGNKLAEWDGYPKSLSTEKMIEEIINATKK